MSQQIEQQAREWWLALEAGRDDVRLNEQFDAWLAMDDRHRLAWLEVLMADNAAAAQVDTPVEFDQPLPPIARSRRTAPVVQWIGGFSFISLIVLLALAAPHLPRQWQRLNADYQTAPGETRTFTLADGSTLVLGADSVVSVGFDDATRRIELVRGEAELSVGADPRPLALHHDGFAVRDIGTRFRVDESGDALRVSVSEGVVDSSRAGYPDTHRIEAGQRLQWGPSGVEPLSAATLKPEPGLLLLDQADAAQALAQFERMTGRRLKLDGTPSPNRVSAAFPIRDPAQQDAAFASLLKEFGLRVRFQAVGVTWIAAGT
ncbi:MAG: FecR domain-containing protein [Ahniella sp.]|nr:FecR domain-containing protein [Ahniella sp.]